MTHRLRIESLLISSHDLALHVLSNIDSPIPFLDACREILPDHAESQISFCVTQLC